jgi:hypothetical protein
VSDIKEEQRATCIGASTIGSSMSDTQEEKRASCIGASTTTTLWRVAMTIQRIVIKALLQTKIKKLVSTDFNTKRL